MGSVLARWLIVALMAMAALAVTTAQAQMIRMDALPLLLGAREHEPFGRSTALAPAGPLWVKWRAFESELARAEDAVARCRADSAACSPATDLMIALIDEARGADGHRRLGLVNRAINLAVAYASDLSQHGVSDLWSGPLATLERGRGDCEDYAIAKLFVLRAAGIPADDLRLLIAHNQSDGDDHAVLAVRQDGRWLILDNRRMAVNNDETTRDLQPLFALDTGGVRQFGAAALAPALAAAAQTTAVPVSAPAAMAAAPELMPLL